MESLIVIVTETADSQYFANAIGCPISVLAQSTQELRTRLNHEINIHFPEEARPRSIKLYFVREEQLELEEELDLS